MKRNQFEEFLIDSFRDGASVRELRLSQEEIAFIQERFPNAELELSPQQGSSSERQWYFVDLRNSKLAADDSLRHMDMDSLYAEKEKLLLELNALKQELQQVRQELSDVKSVIKY